MRDLRDSHGGVGEEEVVDNRFLLSGVLKIVNVATSARLVGQCLPVEAACVLLDMIKLVVIKVERSVIR